MGRKGGSKVMMALGVFLALISGGIVFVMANSATSSGGEDLKKQVVIARSEIPERSKLTRDMLDVVLMPESVIPPKAYLKLEDVADKVYTKGRLYPRMPITQDQTAVTRPGELPETQPATAPVPKPATPKLIDASFTLESGQTLVSVEYPEAAKLITAGILKAGDRVNIFIKVPGPNGEQVAQVFPSAAFQPQPKPLEIKAIGSLSQTTETTTTSPTMIFQVTAREAVVLKLLETMNPFFLIHPAADGDRPTIRTDVLTTDQIQIQSGLRPLGR